MSVADPASTDLLSAPTPEECDHPAPVVGVMAHEFAPYGGAVGPEGTRRTTMFYGPVVGGLPIDAWHCETCGLLRLTYPDGRREERRLFPGPQPDLIAVPVAQHLAPETTHGRQARVSGVSASPDLIARVFPRSEPVALRLPTVELPDLGWANWLSVLLLLASACGLLVGGIGAVYSYTTPRWELPLFYTILGTFMAAVAVQLLAALQRQVFPFPQLQPSVAVRERGRPDMDAASITAVVLLILVTGGLLLGGILAVYDWRTPAALKPLFYAGLALFLAATAAALVGVVVRSLTRSR